MKERHQERSEGGWLQGREFLYNVVWSSVVCKSYMKGDEEERWLEGDLWLMMPS
jgi:hypothetical protein